MSSDQPIVHLDLDELFTEANKTTAVRSKVVARAVTIAARARRIDAAEYGGKAEITVEDHVLPNGRFVALVKSSDGEGEHGTSATKRRRTLRRAAGGR